MLLLCGSPAAAQIIAGAPAPAIDAAVESVGYRLATRAGDLCADGGPLAGFTVQDLSQYAADERAAARASYGFGESPLVLAVAATSPAAAAGLIAGDALAGIDGQPVDPTAAGAASSYARVAAITAQIESASADGVLALDVIRDGRPISIRLQLEAGCPTRFVASFSHALDAGADGRYVRVNSALVQFAASEDEVAAVVAHELAHNILGHRARLDALGAHRGWRGNFGRSARLIRDTEDEADRLSVRLLARAGYPPQAIVAFWERFRDRHPGRAGGSPTHRNVRERIAAIDDEIARIAAPGAAPISAAPGMATAP